MTPIINKRAEDLLQSIIENYAEEYEFWEDKYWEQNAVVCEKHIDHEDLLCEECRRYHNETITSPEAKEWIKMMIYENCDGGVKLYAYSKLSERQKREVNIKDIIQ